MMVFVTDVPPTQAAPAADAGGTATSASPASSEGQIGVGDGMRNIAGTVRRLEVRARQAGLMGGGGEGNPPLPTPVVLSIPANGRDVVVPGVRAPHLRHISVRVFDGVRAEALVTEGATWDEAQEATALTDDEIQARAESARPRRPQNPNT